MGLRRRPHVLQKVSGEAGYRAEGLGLVAQRDIGRNEVVLEVPKKFWINPETLSASEVGSVCGQKRSSLKLKSEFEVEEEVILPHKKLFPFPITCDDFLWAFGILMSRSFSRLHGQNLVLIPIADLINHNPSITTEEYAWEIKGGGLFSRDVLFSLRSPVSVKAGEQVNFTCLPVSSTQDDSISMLVALRRTDAFLLELIFRNAVWGHLELPKVMPMKSSYAKLSELLAALLSLAIIPPLKRLQIAVGTRAGEKKVLQQIDGIFKERELELNEFEYYQERTLKDLGLVGEQDVVWDSSVKQSYDSVHSRAKVFVIVSIAKLFTRYVLKLRCEDMLSRAKNESVKASTSRIPLGDRIPSTAKIMMRRQFSVVFGKVTEEDGGKNVETEMQETVVEKDVQVGEKAKKVEGKVVENGKVN
ncbi:hypothetical protein RHSIM_Rhsim12G0125500 [Rhododendron simsii]|uniref:SET domain-containing protein n=1 Tax=Rhododendron simsii TaxID=118357 RepID=A0A834G2H4_RHOSS|nr:hypothetical protein RHSIM_Rhsim12G0125500 [Rhododendron simsii]